MTVIDGVMTPSASRAPPPIIVNTTAHVDFFFIRANRAKMPPSPLLSALMVIVTYLIVVERVRVQKIHDNEPYINKSFMLPPLPTRIARIVYNGLVPRSPKTIPRVTITPASESSLISCLLSFDFIDFPNQYPLHRLKPANLIIINFRVSLN